MTQEERFLKYEKMIQQIAWSINRKTGVDFADLYSEGCLAFLTATSTHSAEKGSFSTWLYHRVNGNLLRFAGLEMASRGLPIDMCMETVSTDPTPEDYFLFEERMGSLSKRATKMCDIIIENPGEYYSGTPRLSKTNLKESLREKGWTWDSIWDTFREVKEALA